MSVIDSEKGPPVDLISRKPIPLNWPDAPQSKTSRGSKSEDSVLISPLQERILRDMGL
ncbi:MAG: hypothetical protein AAB738_02625 [Patescibacteria group bacterium]